MQWAIAVHGGAGDWPAEDEAAALRGVRDATMLAASMLAAGGSALDAVVAAVSCLEDDALFNAGTGCVLNRDGEAELDASVMKGDTLSCGGVAALRRVRNPVQVARRVMERTPHVLLAGAGALAFARSEGFPDHDPVTARSRARWANRRDAGMPGTVGAVALDRSGCFAAATSTGGVQMKLPGRVGDSPIPGAGNYANDAAACSATGKGELMMRVLAAKALCDRVVQGESAGRAVAAQLDAMQRTIGSDCGFILVTHTGVGIGHRTRSMPHGWQTDADAQAQVRMHAPAG